MTSLRVKFAQVAPMFLVVALAGCATSGPRFDETRASAVPVQKDLARIYFYRPGKFMGSAIQPAVEVDGVKVGDAVPGGYFYIDEPAGTHEISTTTETKEYIKVAVKPGDTRYVRLEADWGYVVGRVTPVLVWPEQGLSEIQDLHYVGAS